MNVLVINCGSSSIKYQLFDMADESLLARGIVERIGEPQGRIRHTAGEREAETEQPVPDHQAAFAHIRRALVHPDHGPIESPDDLDAIGHRVVHAGESFTGSVRITEEVIAALQRCADLAPLHNPPNLAGVRCAEKAFPGKLHVGVFDTAFHQTMPPRAYVYALPYELYEEAGIRRYGFHGTSHRFVAARAAEVLGIAPDELFAITCHLGNGCSMAAVAEGRSVDTSMGLTPLEGLVMGTRCGDIDPAIIFQLARSRGLSLDEINTLVNKHSGLLGLSGVSNDVRTLLDAASENPRARLALDVFAYRVRKYIGAYLAALGRCHAVVLTGGIGENAAPVRQDILDGLGNLGIELDQAANAQARGTEADIATDASTVRILVVPTNEELMIARDTVAEARRGLSS